MEELKKTETTTAKQTVVCKKCHKQVSPNDGKQTSNGFICKSCFNKNKRIIALLCLCGVLLLGGATAFFLYNNHQKKVVGFKGVSEIKDSIKVDIPETHVTFSMEKSTAISAPVGVVDVIENLESFKRAIAQNVQEAESQNVLQISFPPIEVFFDFDTAVIHKDGVELINVFAQTFMQTNKEATILVESDCCDIGDDEANNSVSRKRAMSVKAQLEKNGIPSDKIELKWYGKSRYNTFHYKTRQEYRRAIISIKKIQTNE